MGIQANRTRNIQDSVTVKISALAKKMKADGQDVIGFGAGEPDFDTPDNIKQAAIDAINAGKNGYTAATGIIELKDAICTKLKRDHGLDYGPNNIIISCGAKHTLFNLILALINPGDEVIIPAPYWVSYPDQVSVAEGKSVILETDDKTDFKITAEQLEAAITPKTKLFILTSPSNPTGMVYSRDELKAIADVIVKHDILVISDEIYEQLTYGTEHISIASFSDEIKQRTLLVNGLSKAYAMTGWRLGYMAVPEDIAKIVSKIQSHSTTNPTTCAQWAGVEALLGPQDAIDVMKVEYDKRRRYMVDTLNAMPGVTCVTPEGAFYAFPNVSGCYGKSSPHGTITNSIEFCDHLLKEKLVACVPGSAFGSDDYLRLSYATSMDNIQRGLDRIREFVEELK